MPWLDETGVTHLWSRIKTHINSVVPKANYSTTTYTSFSGSVATGSVTVTKKLGVCYIIGTLTLSGKVSSWTTILGNSAIPAPQHGVLVPFEMSQWKASYAQALRGKITPDGELQLVYGAAGNYVINISYPID